MPAPSLLWDWGTAYDLFPGLEVLHQPAEFGVRAAWAAGVRARLPAGSREILEVGALLCPQPLHWIHRLPDPKDAITALSALGQVPSGERLSRLALVLGMPADVQDMLLKVSAHGSWDERDLGSLRDLFRLAGDQSRSEQDLAAMLGWWTRAEEFGQRYLEGLRVYFDAFFAEEETRLRPVLRQALVGAQKLAGGLALAELLEELSQTPIQHLPELDELVLVPSFWLSPRTSLDLVDAGRGMWVFGTRPAEASLVPGELVPETILRTLKALSDPTRLRILQHLAGEQLTVAELARRLRLRAQTVSHHVKSLRLAGLVHTSMGDLRSEKYYSANRKAVAETFDVLDRFLESGKSRGSADEK